jgi:hypothetical protein
MTASTNTILLRSGDGTTTELSGVMYAEETTHDRTGEAGVAVQFTRQPGDSEAETRFVEGATLVGVYDDICEDPVAPEYRAHVITEE